MELRSDDGVSPIRPVSPEGSNILMHSGSSDELVEYGPDSAEPTVVVPTYNERATILEFIGRTLAAFDGHSSVIVVDDDSPDGTARLVREEYGHDDRVRVLVREDDQGLASAVAEGLDAVETAVAVVADADLQHPPAAFPELAAAVRDGADIAVGSRYCEEGAIRNWSVGRRILSYGARTLSRLAVPSTKGLTDPISGLFALHESVIEGVQLEPAGFKILLELLEKGNHDGDIVEVPYVFRQRSGGESNLGPAEFVQFLEHLVSLRRYRRGTTTLHENAPRPNDGDVASTDGGHSGVTPAPAARSSATDESARSGERADRPSGERAVEDLPTDVAILTAYPPTNDGLANYGRNLAEAYSEAVEDVRVIASDERSPNNGDKGLDSANESANERPDIDVDRVWRKDDPRGLLNILRTLRADHDQFDLLHFNLKPTYYGSNNLLRFCSLFVPLAARGFLDTEIVVTMHDIFETVDHEKIDEDVGFLEQVGATAATAAVLLAAPVTVTNDRHRTMLEDKYPMGDVTVVPHGVPRTTARGSTDLQTDPFRTLLFGYVSPYKDYAGVLKAFRELREVRPDAELHVAGGRHPSQPELYDDIKENCETIDGATFHGYIPEDRVEAFFADSSVLVLPYETAPGVSGPFQVAKATGLPVVIYDNPDVVEATVGTGGDAFRVEPGDSEMLAECLTSIAVDTSELEDMSRRNRNGDDTTMSEVTRRIRSIASDTNE